MTLTRSPCELEKMSLFQDLKLKRRKVDSRCSSDGESVADTSTSSPDLVPPPSPTKMTDAAAAHAALAGGHPTTPPSPDSTPHSYHHQHHHHLQQQLLQPKQEPTLDKMAGRLEDSGVFDGGGTASVIKTLPSSAMPAVKRSHSPPIRPAPPFSPSHQPPRPHSSPGRPSVSPRASPVIRHAPLLVPATPSPPRCVPQHQQQQPQEPTSSMSSSSSSSSPSYSVSSKASSRGVIISQQQHQQHQQQQQNQLWLQHSRINGVKPELIGGSFATPAFPSIKPELIGGTFATAGTPAFPDLLKGPVHHHHQQQQQQQQRPGTNLPSMRQAPTVIMGEAGGVRTMIWSQPISPVDPQSVVHPTTSQWPLGGNAAVSNTEENAAQMLLNLGQDRLRLAAAAAAAAVSPRPPTSSPQSPASSLNMEQLWANEPKSLPANQQTQALNLSSPPMVFGSGADMKPFLVSDSSLASGGPQDQNEEEEQPMICMICEDKATGLHYGIITCEGCKGFFKRTVQNRRVYTCVADGNCEITKAQRNRCQYCRFKKCIEQGMVLQAVREDRMPGGRNSGAVYNLYKVKYKKHKKPSAKQQTPKQQQLQQQQQQQQQQQHQQEKTSFSSPHHFKQEHHQHLQQQQQQQQQQFAGADPSSPIPSNLVNGTILKTALTNPSEVIRLRQRLDSAVSSSRDRSFSFEYSLSMIKTLIDCDEFQDIATLQNLDELLDHNNDLSDKLRKIGDSIVLKLVQWTKRLPFYLELPVEVHTRLLTHKWHELLVLTTSAYQAIHNAQNEQFTTLADTDFSQEVEANLCTLQNCLRSMMGREITIEQLRQDVGLMIEKITHVTLMFKQIKLTMEEYVCLKVITMLNEVRPASSTGSNDLEIIHERYMMCLRVYTQHIYPQQTTRFQDLLVRLPEIQSAASLLLESKMFYVPFLLNSAIQR